MHTTSSRSTPRTLLITLAMVLTFLAMPAASAADDHLEVSLDGASWSSSLPDALFEDDIVLVPGQSVTTQLHLRSTAPATGALELALTSLSASDRWASQSFGIRAELADARGDDARGSALPRTRFADLEEGTSLGRPVLLEPGEAVILTVTIDLDEHTTGHRAQNSAIGLDLEITFSDALAAGEGGSGEDERGDHDPEATSVRVLPVLGPEESTSHPVPHPSTEHVGDRSTSNDPRTQSSDRGLLAVTGVPAQGMMIGCLALFVLGAVLLHVSRRRAEEKR